MTSEITRNKIKDIVMKAILRGSAPVVTENQVFYDIWGKEDMLLIADEVADRILAIGGSK